MSVDLSPERLDAERVYQMNRARSTRIAAVRHDAEYQIALIDALTEARAAVRGRLARAHPLIDAAVAHAKRETGLARVGREEARAEVERLKRAAERAVHAYTLWSHDVGLNPEMRPEWGGTRPSFARMQHEILNLTSPCPFADCPWCDEVTR